MFEMLEYILGMKHYGSELYDIVYDVWEDEYYGIVYHVMSIGRKSGMIVESITCDYLLEGVEKMKGRLGYSNGSRYIIEEYHDYLRNRKGIS